VSFSSASQNVSEGAGSASITVSLDHPSAFNISVDYALSGTATNGSDYSATSSGTLTFTAGQTSKTISATITDDSNLESTETIIATLSNLTGTASIGSTSTHTLSIIDNDQVNLSINDVTAAEGGTLTFTVSASMAPSANATFDWTTANGTVIAGSDYTAASGTGTILAGQTTTTISISTLHNPAVCESNKTVAINLSNPSNANIADSQGLGTLTDSDLPVLSVANASATEGSPVVVVASLSAACASHAVTFDWSNSAGTATATTDYAVVTSQSATIAAGSTSVNLSTPTVQDTVDENNETFTVTIANASGATLGTSSATATILDDDAARSPAHE
jgi:hypothetical protein